MSGVPCAPRTKKHWVCLKSTTRVSKKWHSETKLIHSLNSFFSPCAPLCYQWFQRLLQPVLECMTKFALYNDGTVFMPEGFTLKIQLLRLRGLP
jgi:hypothetical protein